MIIKGFNLLIAFLLLSSIVYAQANQKQENEETIKVDATLVNVPFEAIDNHGRHIADLREEDIRIFENGIEQEIGFFTAETVPFHVILLLDVSGSTRSKLIAIKEAARRFIDNLQEKDQVMVISFGTNITIQNEFTTDKKELFDAIRSIKSGGSTRLYDAVLLSTRSELKRVTGRKALIVLTDGDDTSSYMSAKYVIGETLETGTIVYAVRYPTTLQSISNRENRPIRELVKNDPNSFIQDLVDKTGGMLYDAASIYSISNPLKSVAEDLRHIYTIGYYPSNSVQNGGYRKINLNLPARPDVQLRYKTGYQADDLTKRK